MSLRKVIKTRASFPNDEAAFKLLYLALRNAAKKWTMPIKQWGQAMQAFSIIFEGRVPTLSLVLAQLPRYFRKPSCQKRHSMAE